jgi:hypothetical protein|tara:strand:- start:6451 stop:7128 length:678 start_codon:yes stop_codon:yes gene_type:complete
MSYYKLKDRIFHHSEKFKALIEAQDGVELMETEDYGWENYRYENDRFRLAHVERYSHMGLEVVHITCFPRESSKMPMFGFDVVGYQNDEKQMSKISGVFMDWSPVMFEEKWHDTTWNKDRKLPVWATVFSKDFIAVRPTEDEYERIFEVGFDAFERWLDKLNSDEHLTDSVNDIETIIKNQNTYCEHQASNKRTFGALKANIGEEKAKFFMEEVLFPKIKYDKMS